MPCYMTRLEDGRLAHICGELGPHCGECSGVGDYLCDYPVGDGKTCDRPLCEHHAKEVAPEIHYCPSHWREWNEFRQSGGVERELKTVTPFNRHNT